MEKLLRKITFRYGETHFHPEKTYTKSGKIENQNPPYFPSQPVKMTQFFHAIYMCAWKSAA